VHRLQRYYDILDGIEAERAHEEAYYRSLSQSRKISERIDSGIVWYPVQVNKKHYTVGELVEIEIEQSKSNNQAHKFKTGMGCELFSQGEQEVRFKGVVSYIRRQKMGIIFNSSVFDKSSIPEYGNLGVELVYDERPYRVMKASIEDLLKAKEPAHQALRDGIVEHSDFSDLHFNATFDYQLPPEINFSQKKAIENCLQANHMAIIHGPPGTGKTTTICALARTLIQKEKQILVCAPSNNAVDLLARKLDAAGLNVLRLGNVSRIGDSIAHLSLEEKASRHKEWSHIKKS
jgi:ATP-dependent RNA/DNA helicase IGHMBP2